ncbi:MAG: bifunctional (p)ppGpp synthetase/guanosine-3',5'-bis(diphosphate) 3'-pyrophosphohydrolase [Planctomycetia bacterium]|nr:bifunctional (p)ppGpp synthetase/guanosine-3',5'-bis(diphosphate) 3'-pyrophosphohydrolase [Planctomycetia bacterium]
MQLTARFSQALAYAFELHGEQLRKGSGVPYLSHVLAVAAIALEYGASEDEAIAALLHDAIEDQGGAPVREEIRRRFGRFVAEIVDGCTDAETLPKPPWRERKEKYLAALPRANASVHLISAADKLHNARSIMQDYRVHGESLWNRFGGGKSGTLWYYRAVVTALGSARKTAIVEELERAVTMLESLAGASTEK